MYVIGSVVRCDVAEGQDDRLEDCKWVEDAGGVRGLRSKRNGSESRPCDRYDGLVAAT